MPDLRCDAFLGGRLQIQQPVAGYRAGADAVMLAAACPATGTQSVLELGCGAGVALLCLGARQPDLHLSGLELQEPYANLARQNAVRNGRDVTIHLGDLAQMPKALRETTFDHVMANPPYFLDGTLAPDAGRGTARHEATPLAVWIAAGLRRLRPGGWLTVIQRADRLGDILAALTPASGAITILPIIPRQGRDAGRVIVAARKGARAPLRLLSPFVLHAKLSHSVDAEDLTEAAQAVLRHAGQINLSGR